MFKKNQSVFAKKRSYNMLQGNNSMFTKTLFFRKTSYHVTVIKKNVYIEPYNVY